MIGGFEFLRKNVRKQEFTGDEAVARLRAAADKMEPRIALAFNEALNQLRDRVPEDRLVELIERGDINTITNELLGPNVTRDVFQGVEAAIGAAVLEGGRVAAEIQPAVRAVSGAEVQFVFNATNPRLAEYANTQTTTRVREISEDVRNVTRSVIRDGTLRGENPRAVARRVRESIGLTARQEQAVQNYRRALEELDSTALARELRDRRFDSTIRRAIENNQPLSGERIDRMVERYRQRYIKYRSEVIARTEAIRAVQGAQNEFIQGYVDEGRIAREQVRRFWKFTQDERTRAEHRRIPAMNPNGVGMNEAFDTPLGPLRFPGDPNGTAANTVQCILPGTKVEGRFIGALKSFYSGKAVKIKARGGTEISVTPNHPVLTNEGWVAANRVSKFHKLVSTNYRVEESVGVRANNKQSSPTKIEEVFSSLSKFFHPLPAGMVAVDFNGDEKFVDGDVDVVLSNGFLMREIDSSKDKLRSKFSLEKSGFEWAGLSGGSDREHGACGPSGTSGGSMSSGNLTFNRFWVFLDGTPFKVFSFGSPAWFDSMVAKDSIYHASADGEIGGDVFNTLPGSVHIDNRHLINMLDISSAKCVGAILDKKHSYTRSVESYSFRDGVTPEAGLVEFDDVVSVDTFDYSGHVYDLQSASGSILADGVILGNCRCHVFVRVVSAELLEAA